LPKYLYIFVALILTGAGALMMAFNWSHGFSWFVVQLTLLCAGATMLGRLRANKPLLPTNFQTRQMATNAYEKWPLGLFGTILFIATFLLLLLSRRQYYNYGVNHPWITLLAVTSVAAVAFYCVGKYLYYVQYGNTLVAESPKQNKKASTEK